MKHESSIRNTHNFIKAILIKRFVQQNKRILDLGCGNGGDLLKLKHSKPSLYVGIDISPLCVQTARERFSKVNMNCTCHLICSDFTQHDWNGYPPYDVINCQFAIQFAFQNERTANFTIEKISHFLIEDGLFIGTLPIYDTKSYALVKTKVLGDVKEYEEYAVEENTLIDICLKNSLHIVTIENFNTFFTHSYNKYFEIAKKMNAHVLPDPKNNVFVFQKRTLNHHHP